MTGDVEETVEDNTVAGSVVPRVGSRVTMQQVAAELGVDVPGRLSVVGFDNIPESALSHPPLTTVQQPMRQMGHDAIAMLVALIAGHTVDETHVTLETTLVPRRTTAAPRS